MATVKAAFTSLVVLRSGVWLYEQTFFNADFRPNGAAHPPTLAWHEGRSVAQFTQTSPQLLTPVLLVGRDGEHPLAAYSSPRAHSTTSLPSSLRHSTILIYGEQSPQEKNPRKI
ncbi:hypothetical protein DMENIID0001_129100 [Sergentomyia squamirostris]